MGADRTKLLSFSFPPRAVSEGLESSGEQQVDQHG